MSIDAILWSKKKMIFLQMEEEPMQKSFLELNMRIIELMIFFRTHACFSKWNANMIGYESFQWWIQSRWMVLLRTRFIIHFSNSSSIRSITKQWRQFLFLYFFVYFISLSITIYTPNNAFQLWRVLMIKASVNIRYTIKCQKVLSACFI